MRELDFPVSIQTQADERISLRCVEELAEPFFNAVVQGGGRGGILASTGDVIWIGSSLYTTKLWASMGVGLCHSLITSNR